MTDTILIVDDDPQIRRVVDIALRDADFRTEQAGDGAEALKKAQSGRFSLIILDIGLPEMDGLAVCRELRKADHTPVVFLTARQDEIDRILGFEMGGDDYLSKPFSPRELVARVKAILRRGKVDFAGAIRTIGHLTINADAHVVTFKGQNVSVTGREMTILNILSGHKNQVFARPDLVDQMYGHGLSVSDRTLDSHLRNLRAKFDAVGCSDAIDTLHGVGLRMGPLWRTARQMFLFMSKGEDAI